MNALAEIFSQPKRKESFQTFRAKLRLLIWYRSAGESAEMGNNEDEKTEQTSGRSDDGRRSSRCCHLVVLLCIEGEIRS